MPRVRPAVPQDDVLPEIARARVEEVLAVELALGVRLGDEGLVVREHAVVREEGRRHVDEVGPGVKFVSEFEWDGCELSCVRCWRLPHAALIIVQAFTSNERPAEPSTVKVRAPHAGIED